MPLNVFIEIKRQLCFSNFCWLRTCENRPRRSERHWFWQRPQAEKEKYGHANRK